MQTFKNHIIAALLLFCASSVYAHSPRIFFTENKGQWHQNVKYMLRHGNGNLFLEDNSLTWLFYDHTVIDKIHGHVDHSPIPDSIQAHSLKVNFLNANKNPIISTSKKTSFYSNYFIGNDESKWASNVSSYQEIEYHEIYNGVKLKFYQSGEQLKYDFIVDAGVDASIIKIKYDGANDIRMSGENLLIKTSVNDLIEEKPYAYQVINGIKTEVKCKFKINKNKEITFNFPNGYELGYELIIDPILIFGTYTGSSADNFGFTATYDDQKNTYVGGIVFSLGTYPTTTGAFQLAFAGTSGVDIGISKYNVSGTNMIYSTYIGGTSSEAPHSLVTNANGELFILGTTSSSNYPVTAGCFDSTFNGGSFVSPPSSGMSYPNGADIIVTHLNAGGNSLIGSTFIGGTGTDGLNLSTNLAYNYGDVFRGEIIVDNNGNCIVNTTTDSPDIPTSANAPFPTALGGTDAFSCQLNPGLTTMLWGTYFGGSSNDSGYGVQIDSNGEIYCTGGTESNNLLVSPGVIKSTYGGLVDGYIVRYSNTGTSILSCTYVGTASYDQTYFVQLDLNDDVYVVGQTTGNYPITAGTYNNPNSGQFIQKLDKTFATSLMSTSIGRGNGKIDISPSAFLVNTCGHIYLSGWGGPLNALYLADFSGTSGLPVTADAIQSNTDNSDFYLMVLDVNATGLLFATFLGGPLSSEHVDGGTSRFDKDGVVYQAVCAGCGSNDDFPTTPGAWSNINNSTNCNLGTIKFDMAPTVAQTNFAATTYCSVPVEINFNNTSAGSALSYFWDFGDGVTSTDSNPTHTYQSVGTYTVMLIATNSNICNGIDTVYYTVTIPPPPTLSVPPPTTICHGDSLLLNINATGGNLVYNWNPNSSISSTSIEDPIIFPTTSTEYIITIIDTNGCSLSDTIPITVNPHVTASYTSIGTPCQIPFFADFINGSSNAYSYFWDFGDGTTSTSVDPHHIYNTPGNYLVTLIVQDSSFCQFSDTAITVITVFPELNITVSPGDTICSGEFATLWVDQGETFLWSPASNINDPTSQTPTVVTYGNTFYTVIATDTNGCTDTGYVEMAVFPFSFIDAGTNQIYDIGPGVPINATIPSTGSYYWSPTEGLSCSDCPNPIPTPESSTMYYLHYVDTNGCQYVDSIFVQVTPSVFVPNAFTPNGDDKNNFFKPIVRNLSSYELFIFNRWGQLIFNSNDTEASWNGTYRGTKCPVDVYVWKIKYASELNPEIFHEIYGHVTLIR